MQPFSQQQCAHTDPSCAARGAAKARKAARLGRWGGWCRLALSDCRSRTDPASFSFPSINHTSSKQHTNPGVNSLLKKHPRHLQSHAGLSC